jgi:PAS domain-containing protein
VHSGELVWSDETYKILGYARETNPTLDLVFDRVHPQDRDRLQQLRDGATQNGMDLDVEHRILLPDGVIKYVRVVAHAGRDHAGKLSGREMRSRGHRHLQPTALPRRRARHLEYRPGRAASWN